ncbi:teichoic acid biosynthesis protein F [Staphylococcus gallinarum]|uniref:Teichoic acid biosynthesis protein F n=1 Tax=Staphylococcus gallinarum TaxID=1293 RepID=A0A380FI66_STAGA|nr:teichoic acid biosynthesis protein F [Staphylococcus gallinarum]
MYMFQHLLYETLGYSILETIGIGNQALIYAGNDNVLKEIYEKYHGISFLTKHFQKDSEKLIAVLDGKYTKEQRNEDIEKLET